MGVKTVGWGGADVVKVMGGGAGVKVMGGSLTAMMGVMMAVG